MRSIITRVLAAVLTVVTAFSAALAYNTSEQRRLLAQMARVNQGFVPISRQLDSLEEEVRAFGRVLSNAEPTALRQSLRASMTLFPFTVRIDASLVELRAHLDAMLALELTDTERAFVTNVRLVGDELAEERVVLDQLTTELLRQLDADPPQTEPYYGELGARVIAFERRVDRLTQLVDGQTDAALIAVREAERVLLMRVIIASLAATVLALIIILIIGRSLAPIRSLTQLASRFKQGDYSHDPIEAGNDEIGTLAREFSGMASAIEERDAILRRQKSELEEAYRQLVEAQRAQVQAERLAAVGEISARVTHELRNPLSSIGLNVEMLNDELTHADSPADLSEARLMLGAIDREVARLTELTERYLSMARSDDPRKQTHDLVELVRDTCHEHTATLERTGTTLRIEAPAPITIEVDGPQIRQVLINLLRNAGQAVGQREHGQVWVHVARRGGSAVVAIEDNGDGISDTLATRVFEPFVTEKPDGTGLGLSISRTIARKHDGDLVVGAPRQLSGARFELLLPL